MLKYYKMSEVCNITTGKLDANAQVENGEYPFFTCDRNPFRINTFAFDCECVLIGGNNASGNFPINYYNGKFNAYQRTYVITMKKDVDINIKYIYHALKHELTELKKRSRGSLTKFLTIGLLENIKFPILSKEKYDTISYQIEVFENMINNNNELIENLIAYSQGVFHKWFIDFNFPDNKNNPYKESGGEMVEIGNLSIPKSWDYGAFTIFGEFIGGGTPSSTIKEYFSEDCIPWLTPKDLSISPQMYTAHGERDITELGLKNSSAVLIPARSVLMSSRAPIGYMTIARNSIATNQGFKSIVPNDDRYSEFIYFSLRDKMNKINMTSSGSTFSEVSKGMMERLKTTIPPEYIIVRYYENMRPFFMKIDALTVEQKSLTQMRDLLINILI